MKARTLALVALLLIGSLSIWSVGARADVPVVWKQSKWSYFIDFNDCFDNPVTPNPAQVLNTPLSFPNTTGSQSFVTIFAFVRERVSLGGCLAPVFPIVNTITDPAGNVYTRRVQFKINPALAIPWFGEIWTGKITAPMQTLTMHLDTAHLRVYAHATEWTGVNSFVSTPYFEPSGVSGDFPYANVTWANTTGVFWGSLWGNQLTTGCNGKEPACVFPATSANAGTGGYNENFLTVACTVPPSGGCASNTNSNGKTGGAENKTALGGDGISIYQFHANVSLAGQRTMYVHSTSAAFNNVGFIGMLLYPFVTPPAPPPPDPFSAKIASSFIVFGFIALLILAVMGAIWLRQRFS